MHPTRYEPGEPPPSLPMEDVHAGAGTYRQPSVSIRE